MVVRSFESDIQANGRLVDGGPAAVRGVWMVSTIADRSDTGPSPS
ncbi:MULTISPECIES: hypothetical protein [Nonomuraea]|uniref:Uncharacterized protein n=1 Tax=Nonomuraea mangrovi TaxID=2316207 RepID=A0ABW4SN76_9ACTN